MDKKFPCFISRQTPVGKKVKYRTKTINGKIIEINFWELIEKYGADKVLQMRTDLPEYEEED